MFNLSTLYGKKILSNWGLAWSACFLQLFGQSNKIGGKMLQILWILWNGDNFPSNSFPLYCALARAKIQVHWVNGTLRNCGRTGLALSTPALSAFQLFLWIFSTPGLPFTTASLVIYGNPCGMQDGYSIFIENYQSEDLGSIHRRSKPSLHLPDSFRLKISENLATKTFQKFWETVFSSTKVLTGADTSAPLAGILNLIYAGSQCLCPGWDVCFLSTVMWVFNTCWA